MNDAMSFGVHRLWKDMTLTRANPQPGELLIDVAGGTGDLARLFVAKAAAAARRRGGPPARAIVCDINHEMLKAGRARPDQADEISWVTGDAERLPFPDRTANAVTIAFGIRNVTDRAAALAEMRRVLKPGGRFLCLEFSKPTTAALEAVYDAWSFQAIPRIGSALAGDRESYEYLVESIRRFPDQAAFKREVEAAGFAKVSVTNFSGGVAALHMGWRI
jgi:demethylmenaquinone methyltransferase/2-methoxy-6-polyprenyl-1,4-benzoquinol methylase